MLALPMPALIEDPEKISFSRSVCLENVGFRYEQGQPYIINNLSLKIMKGESIGIIGKTGSGKSTLLIHYVYCPSYGTYSRWSDLHDSDEPVTLASWRSTIAHVPQAIFTGRHNHC